MIDDGMVIFASILKKWNAEIESQIKDACGILKEATGSDRWWAKVIQECMTSQEGPSAERRKDGEEMLVDISFWSGWLRGQRDALARCQDAFEVLNSSCDSQSLMEDWDMKSTLGWLEAHSNDPALDALHLILLSSNGRGNLKAKAEKYEERPDTVRLLELAFELGKRAGGAWNGRIP